MSKIHVAFKINDTMAPKQLNLPEISYINNKQLPFAAADGFIIFAYQKHNEKVGKKFFFNSNGSLLFSSFPFHFLKPIKNWAANACDDGSLNHTNFNLRFQNIIKKSDIFFCCFVSFYVNLGNLKRLQHDPFNIQCDTDTRHTKNINWTVLLGVDSGDGWMRVSYAIFTSS